MEATPSKTVDTATAPRRPLPNALLPKRILKRKLLNVYIACCELGGAFLLAFLCSFVMPHTPAANRVFELWCVFFTTAWVMSLKSEGDFYFHPYARLFKVMVVSAMAFLLFTGIFRIYYSLHFLALVSFGWLSLAFVNRSFAHRYSPKIHVASPEALPEQLLEDPRLHCHEQNIPEHIKIEDMDFLVINFHGQHSDAWQQLLTHAHVAGVPVVSVPEFIEKITQKTPAEYLQAHWWQQAMAFSPLYAKFKRLLDLLLLLVLSPVLIPLTLLVGAASAIAAGAPIFFVQKRVGRDNKPFNMIKFRTMKPTDTSAPVVQFAQLGDARIHPFGALLRRYRLDELPQFWNVLKGDMSIIGPRPEQVPYAEQFSQDIPMYAIRHWVRPGITGWAQVNQGYADSEATTRLKLQYDLYYVKNLSPWLDITITMKTILIILTGFGCR